MGLRITHQIGVSRFFKQCLHMQASFISKPFACMEKHQQEFLPNVISHFTGFEHSGHE